VLAAGAGCAPGPEPGGVAAEAAAPTVRVAVATGRASLAVGGGAPLLLADRDGAPLAVLPAGRTASLVPAAGQVEVRLEGGRVAVAPAVRVASRDDASPVRLAGTDYRGELSIRSGPDGLLAINRVDLEDYLAGVVNTEMGRRAAGERAALEAQAVVSRTYALRAQARWRAREYDLLATVADQAYGGVGSETPLGREAVEATRGTILVWLGQPIEAFFPSTCGGRTAAGPEVFSGGDLPYLRSVSDAAPDGTDWCAISPRYRWTERWSAEALHATLRATLPAATAAPLPAGEFRDIAVTGRTGSGRVQSLLLGFGGATVPVTGPVIRQVLQPGPGQLLRSAAFELQLSREGTRLVRVEADGQGAGHGVGMCQWGAVGRARAGATAPAILTAYFPGAGLERRW
jgi:stage II sporulation protein D